VSARAPLRVGFVALTDAAPVIVAHEHGHYAARGLAVRLVKLASWPALRDAVLAGELDAAHCLASLPFSVAAGVTGRPGQRLPIAMALSAQGQAITLSAALADPAFADPATAGAALAERAAGRRLTLAMTYPGGTHDIWLRYWLMASGIDMSSLDIIPIPPAQMVANLRGGTMDGFSAGEPWNAVAAEGGAGFTAITTADIAPALPEKALVVNPATLARRPGEVRELVAATLGCCRLLDDPAARRDVAQVLGARRYVNAPWPAIERRLLGRYPRGGGLPPEERVERAVAFHRGGAVNAPRRAHALWFIAQLRRMGLARGRVDAGRLVADLVLRDLYEEVARGEGAPVPADDMAPVTIALDGARFDPEAPAAAGLRVA